MPKFDYIIQNPPYKKTLHLDFFNKGLDLLSETGKMIIIEPSTFYINIRKNGKAKKLSSFKVGKEVTVYHSPKMTRSIPAQSAAYAVVLGDNSEKMGKFFKVEDVTMSEDKTYVSVINTNESLIATVDKKANKNFAEIKAGDNLMVWYDMITMSLPARTNANKVVIL